MLRADHPPCPGPAADVLASVLHAPAPADRDRGVEDWIVRMLGGDGATTADDPWAELIGRMAPTWSSTRPTAASSRGASGLRGWPHFQATRRRGITVVVLNNRSLLKDHVLTELSGDLRALIAAGHTRLVLDFRQVERLSSWVVAMVAELARRSVAAPGGALKVCGLRPELAVVFALAGLPQRVAICPDEAAAIDGPWPPPPSLRPLPVAVLVALADAAGADGASRPSWPRKGPTSRPRVEHETMSGAWLVIEVGQARGRTLAVGEAPVVIGRDAACQIRPTSPAVSRRHAAIERHGDRVVVRDLGSTNGTRLNGRLLRDAEAEARHGDLVEVGPLVARVALRRPADEPSGVDDLVVDWLRPDPEGDEAPGEFPTFHDATAMEPDDGRPVAIELIEDVVVVTPRQDDLEDKAATEHLRGGLASILDRATSRRVVVNLTHVGQIGGRAIGVLVAFYLKLEALGGAVRVCEASPRVAAVLDQVELPALIACHATLDDAVLAAWPESSAEPGGTEV